jgi:riboflavin biosynthesis pyrimidine reductase
VILTRAFPAGSESIDLDAADARDRVRALYRPRSEHWVRLNLIGSVSGSATGSDGTSETLTSPTDRLLLGVIRSLSDVVLVGAASVRAEGYSVPRTGALAIVSRGGDFTGHRIRDTEGRGSVLVLCPAAAVERARDTIGRSDARIVAVPDVEGSLTSDAILGALHREGYASIVAEGGPSLATQLVTSGVVDELCLTISPVLNGGRVPLFGAKEFADHPLVLDQLLLDESGASYARWTLSRPV